MPNLFIYVKMAYTKYLIKLNITFEKGEFKNPING